MCSDPYLRLGTEAKIDELQVRIFIDEDVFWLEVPMCISYRKILQLKQIIKYRYETVRYGTYLPVLVKFKRHITVHCIKVLGNPSIYLRNIVNTKYCIFECKKGGTVGSYI
jgi:hypothetical protein